MFFADGVFVVSDDLDFPRFVTIIGHARLASPSVRVNTQRWASSAVPLVSVRTAPSCQATSELETGLELLLPPTTEPHTIMLLGPKMHP
jgi:hypothetical protein